VMLENFGEASDKEKEKQRKDKADATGESMSLGFRVWGLRQGEAEERQGRRHG
jgi:hypothetical protein